MKGLLRFSLLKGPNKRIFTLYFEIAERWTAFVGDSPMRAFFMQKNASGRADAA